MESQLRWLLLNKDKDGSLFHRLLQSEAENETRPRLNPFDGLLSQKRNTAAHEMGTCQRAANFVGCSLAFS
jgi:hypothetical protein